MHNNGKIFHPSVPVVLSPSLLPSEYQQVEYLESSGTQYIDTGYIPNLSTQIDCTFYISSPNSSGSTIGCGFAIATERFLFGINSSGFLHFAVGAPTSTNFIVSNSITNIVFPYNTNYYKYNGDVYTLNNTYVNTSYSFYIFRRNPADGSVFSGRVYHLYISENDTYIYKFIPCYRIADSVAGMYDIINDIFYTNKGTGSFVVGSDCTEILQ